MKSKTLMAAAVAGTFGLSAAAFAGSGHQVQTPFSPTEAGEALTQLHQQTSPHHFSNSSELSIGSSFSTAGGEVSGWSAGSTYGSDLSVSSGDESASLSMDESLALGDEGIYSDFYVVSFEPMTVETWDLYVIDTAQFEQQPTHELALLPSSHDEMVYDLVLTPITYDDMTASFSSDDEMSGE